MDRIPYRLHVEKFPRPARTTIESNLFRELPVYLLYDDMTLQYLQPLYYTFHTLLDQAAVQNIVLYA